MAVFQKFPILIIKEEFPFIWKFGNGRKYQKLTKTDKYLWCKKEENVMTCSRQKKQVGAVNRD